MSLPQQQQQYEHYEQQKQQDNADANEAAIGIPTGGEGGMTWKNRSTGNHRHRITDGLQGRGNSHNGHSSHSLWKNRPSANIRMMHMSPAVYLQRMVDISQMDIQSAVDQMKSLLVPTKINSVYKMAYYRKQTKNHWARDDPAFVFLQIVLLATASLAYAIAFRSDSLVANFLYFSFHGIFINYGLLGLAVASLARYLSNQHLNQTTGNLVGGGDLDNVGGSGGDHENGNGNENNDNSSSWKRRNHHHHSSSSSSSARRPQYYVRQSVEFMYAFDVHCNAFFVLFVLIYGLQFFLLPIVLGKGFFSFLVSNVLYSVAFFAYFYVTHLGYRALPFLYNTEVFLFPLAVVVFVFVLNLIGYPLGFGWNASRIMAHLYFERV